MANEAKQGYAFPGLLVETDRLAEHLYDDTTRIVDADVEPAYQRGHIPGSVLIPDNYEKDPTTNRVHVLPPEQFAEMMESLGIGDNTVVVVYDNSRSLYAGRLWWALTYYGHRNVRVLNGGWRKWVSEGRPISLDSPGPRPAVRFTPNPDASLIIGTAELKEVYGSLDVVVWDVRSRGEYTGENPRHNRRSGHIPGSEHLEWLEMMDGETHTFRPADEMRRLLESKGITPEKEVVAH